MRVEQASAPFYIAWVLDYCPAEDFAPVDDWLMYCMGQEL